MKAIERLMGRVSDALDVPLAVIIAVTYTGMGMAIIGIGLQNGAPASLAVGAAVITVLSAVAANTLLGLLFKGDPLFVYRNG